MKTINRVLLVVAILAASMLGGYLASWLAPAKVHASPLAATFGPPIALTLLNTPNFSTNPDTFGTTAVKIADIGTFMVANSSSVIEVTHQGRLLVDSFSATNSVYYELRVDDANGLPVSGGQPSGLGLVRYQDAGEYVPSVFSGFWQNLATGTHTVSMWVRASSGTANNAYLDPGSWSSNIVIVKEYLPLATTYLPDVSK